MNQHAWVATASAKARQARPALLQGVSLQEVASFHARVFSVAVSGKGRCRVEVGGNSAAVDARSRGWEAACVPRERGLKLICNSVPPAWAKKLPAFRGNAA